jgi:hypothetical protein
MFSAKEGNAKVVLAILPPAQEKFHKITKSRQGGLSSINRLIGFISH